MARIPLSGGFELIPEGWHDFLITEVIYEEDFGKLTLKLRNQDGKTHNERFSLIGGKGEVNTGAMNAFSYLAKVAMKDFSLEEIDHEELLGKFFKAEVKHNTQPNKNDPEKTITFANLGDKAESEGFNLDLGSILGGE